MTISTFLAHFGIKAQRRLNIRILLSEFMKKNGMSMTLPLEIKIKKKKVKSNGRIGIEQK